MKKFVIYLIFVMSSFNSTFSQGNNESNSVNKTIESKVEFFVLPGVMFNHMNLGLSIKGQNTTEHSLSFGSTYSYLFGESFGLSLTYNLNTYLKDSKNYIPVWFRVKNVRRDVGYEEGYHPHTLRFSVGTGFGRHFQLGRKWGLRTEFGIGAAVNLTNASGKVFTFDLDLADYKYDQYYPNQNPKLIPSFRINAALTYSPRAKKF